MRGVTEVVVSGQLSPVESDIAVAAEASDSAAVQIARISVMASAGPSSHNASGVSSGMGISGYRRSRWRGACLGDRFRAFYAADRAVRQSRQRPERGDRKARSQPSQFWRGSGRAASGPGPKGSKGGGRRAVRRWARKPAG
jgi:hypothetical protein